MFLVKELEQTENPLAVNMQHCCLELFYCGHREFSICYEQVPIERKTSVISVIYGSLNMFICFDNKGSLIITVLCICILWVRYLISHRRNFG